MNSQPTPARSPERQGASNDTSIGTPAIVPGTASTVSSNGHSSLVSNGPATPSSNGNPGLASNSPAAQPANGNAGLGANRAPNGTVIAPARYVRFGDFHLDLEREELFRDGARIKLQGKVYQALVALLEKPGDIVTREALRMRLWPSDTHVNYDANVNTTVNKLRQVLNAAEDGPPFVETIPRKGYSFVAKVEFVDQPATRPGRSLQGLESCAVYGEAAGPRALFLGADLPSKWFAAGVICLLLAGMLFGAALMMFVRHFV
jgi:DNA-binding winged helix-turn-helix (wHTH) protein